MSELILSRDMPNCLFGLEQRNETAHQVIASYAKKHAKLDIGIGLAGLLPIPGAATVALVGAVLAQAPLIYGPMTQELAALYSSRLDARTNEMVAETVGMGALADIGVEFFKEIAGDLIGKALAGLALTAVPFVRALLAAGLDAMIAATLTWRVGTVVAAYYQNGGVWVKNRKHTYSLASEKVGPFSPKTDDRANLDDFARSNSTIFEKHIAFALSMIEMMKSASLGRDQIQIALQSKEVPFWVIDQALSMAFTA